MEKKPGGLWIHWVGDAVTGLVLLVTLAVWGGKMDERVTAVERAVAQQRSEASADRAEMKQDIQRELAFQRATLTELDRKITTLLVEAQRRQAGK